MLTKTEIQERLHRFYAPGLQPESPYPAGLIDTQPRPAAVLIPFFEKEDDWHLLFIRRTVISSDHHSGQVAFPGGRCDPTDLHAKNAAIREAHEEVGIMPRDIQILGRVRDMLTISNYIVTPIVGMIPWPYDFIAQENEVARIFNIPLNWLADSNNRNVKTRRLENLGQDVPVVYFQKFNEELLWGASARITLLLLEALGLANPENRYTN